jgi:formylglycine-generating enzyme required for sulfatase activity
LGVAAAAAWKIRQIKASRASAMAPAGGAAPTVAMDPDSPFQATVENRGAAPGPAPEGMVWIPGGEFSMGCDDPRAGVCGGPDAMPDARPIHRVQVDGFWMDRTEVTNAQFARFVAATGYVTMAERTPRQEDFPTAPPENLVAGSTVFTPTAEEVPLTSHFRWWRYEAGANWRHPEGAGTSIDGRDAFLACAPHGSLAGGRLDSILVFRKLYQLFDFFAGGVSGNRRGGALSQAYS